MKVTIDTNIIFQDFHLTSPHFKVFLEHLDTIPATLHVSEVVIDEVVNKYKETLNRTILDIRKAESTLRKTLGVEINSELPNIAEVTKKYKTELIEKLKSHKVDMLKYPT